MEEIILMKSQKNEVMELIKKAELDPFNFKWSVVQSEMDYGLMVSRLDYVDSKFFYQFDINMGGHFTNKGHFAVYSPGKELTKNKNFTENWANQLDYVRYWLSYLRREVDQPDLWEEISKYQIPSGSQVKSDISNEQFNVYQAEKIIKSLNQIRNYIKELGVATEEQSNFVNEKLDYLTEAAKRQGRKDWIHTCIGVLVPVAMELALSPDQAKTVWQLIKNAVSGVVYFLPK